MVFFFLSFSALILISIYRSERKTHIVDLGRESDTSDIEEVVRDEADFSDDEIVISGRFVLNGMFSML